MDTNSSKRLLDGRWFGGGALWIALGGAALAGASASNFMPESRRGTNFWNAASAIDGKMDTAWQVPGDSENKGEWIMLDIPKSTVDKLGMMVGYAKNAESFDDHARVKTVQIEAFQYDENQELKPFGTPTTATFEDKNAWQVVDVGNIELTSEGGGKIKITVTEVYPGRDYPNFAMSELLVYLTEFDVATTISAVSGESAGHDRAAMIDDNAKTFWAGPAANAAITFEAPGYTLSRVGLTPGPAGYARPKKVEIVANGRSHVQELPDSTKQQWIEIPAISGYNGSAWGQIELKILETYPGSSGGDLAISELDLQATAYEGF